MTDAVLGRLLLAFDGLELPAPMRDRLAHRPAAGVTLFRYRNIGSPGQVRTLTDAIQAVARPGVPFLVAIDQEGGQLVGLGDGSTAFPGSMALGAADDTSLTHRVAAAIGLELRAAGVNVNYAPVADLATNPSNPSLGVRSFGDDPQRVAQHVAAFVDGVEAAGVAAAVKHFPGTGGAGADTHHGVAALEGSTADFAARELVPFRAGIAAGASMVMIGHAAAPGLTGDDRPATLSRAVADGLLRDELTFAGVSVSDAFDMDALSPGERRTGDAVTALRSGLDLLLLGSRSDRLALEAAAVDAARAGRLDPSRTAVALDRIDRLRRRLGAAEPAPDVGVIGCEAHRLLAHEAAAAALTLVRDRGHLLPLRLDPDDELLVIMPRPADRTPADTSAAVRPGLAAALRRHHARVTELLVQHAPTDEEIGGAVAAAARASSVVVGTISASLEPSQAALVRAVLDAAPLAVTVALRTPWDLATYPAAGTHVVTYSILDPSLDAVADAMFGRAGFPGRVPVADVVPA